MKIKFVKSYKLSDYTFAHMGNLDSDEVTLKKDPVWRENFYAFTCMEYFKQHQKIFLGSTQFENDIFLTFDPKTKEFESLKYSQFSDDKLDVKIHRSLCVDDDGIIFAAPSGLHDEDQWMTSPGAKIFSYDYPNRKYQDLGIPVEHDYIQTISYDPKRKIIYGFTLNAFIFFAYSLEKRETLYQQPMGSIPHIGVIDDNGGYWGTWGNEHKFFRYDPDTNSCQFHSLHFPEKCSSLMYPKAGPVDMSLNIGDGYLYFGEEKGGLFRLNPQTVTLEYLGRPFGLDRLPGICKGPGNTLLLAGGLDWKTGFGLFDLDAKRFKHLGNLIDSDDQEICFRVHDMAYVGETLYIAEVDHPTRPSRVWEISFY